MVNRTIANADRVVRGLQDILPIEVVSDLKSLPETSEMIIRNIPTDRTTDEVFISTISRKQGACIDMAHKPYSTSLLMVAKRRACWKIEIRS